MNPLTELLELLVALGVAPRLAVVGASDRTAALLAHAGFAGTPDDASRAQLEASIAGTPSDGLEVAALDGADGARLGWLALWAPEPPKTLVAITKAVRAVLLARTELATMKHDLARADRLAMAGQLSAGLAHELGTPLAVVTGRARQLVAGTIPPEQLVETAKTIVEQSERMAGIIRQVLDYSRRRGPRPSRYDVRTVLRQCVALLEPLASKKRVRLAFTDPGAAVVLSFDGSQLMQVMTNLVANAIAATAADGAVSLRLLEPAERTPPADAGLAVGRFAGLVVEDTGHGVNPEHLTRLFEPFFTTKATGEGTGLGLSVATSIVRDHGGWIGVESTRGVGTVFTVYLPG